MNDEEVLSLYLARLSYTGDIKPTLAVLQALHEAHVFTIPFETTDLFRGAPIKHDIDSIIERVVVNKRGGICIAHNLLFAHILKIIGFKSVELYMARALVGPGPEPHKRPRGHPIIHVEIENVGKYLCDVGFGAGVGKSLKTFSYSVGMLTQPVPLAKLGTVHQQYYEEYRIIPDARFWHGHVLQQRADRENEREWQDMYSFDDAPVLPIDCETYYYLLSMTPGTLRQNMIIAKPTPCGRICVVNNEFRWVSKTDKFKKTLSYKEFCEILKEKFGLVSEDVIRDPMVLKIFNL
jgi:N-hydroxyarylamine O-acetyltransferase